MTPMEMLLSRRSSAKLEAPAPDDRALALIVAAARRAPDHGELEPVRLLVISGDGLARLADAGEAALRAREPDAGRKEVEKIRDKLTRAPMVIGLGGRIDAEHRKIPEIEQVLTVGAAGMNLLNALHALGYAGKWVTGANAHDPHFASLLGFEGRDRFYGMFMVGSPKDAPPRDGRAGDLPPHDLSLLDQVRRWR